MREKQEEMLNNNAKLAYKIANKYLINYKDEYEDIKQIALLGLWKAVLNYNDSLKVSFSTFAYPVISNEINQYLRKQKKKLLDVSLNNIVSDNITIEDILKDEENSIERSEENMELLELKEIKEKVLSGVKSKKRDVYREIDKGERQEKIAKIFKISQAQVSRIQKQINEQIKEVYQLRLELEENKC